MQDERIEFTGSIKSFKVAGDASEGDAGILQLVIETACTDGRMSDLPVIGHMKQLGPVRIIIAFSAYQAGLFSLQDDDESRGGQLDPRCAVCGQTDDNVADLPFTDEEPGECPLCKRHVPPGASFAPCVCEGQDEDCTRCMGSGYLRSRCLTIITEQEKDTMTLAVLDSGVFECGHWLPCEKHPAEAVVPGDEEADELPATSPTTSLAGKPKRASRKAKP